MSGLLSEGRATGLLLPQRSRSAAAGIRLVQPGAIAGVLPTFSRAQVAGRATARGLDGLTLAEFGADAPRFDGAGRALLLEGQRTNAATNPRAEGAVAGTPGTPPTGWDVNTAGRTINGVTVVNGIPLLDVTYVEPGAGNRQNRLESGFIAAAAGQPWCVALWVQLLSGTAAQLRLDVEFRDAGGALVAGGASSGAVSTVAAGLVRLVLGPLIAPANTARTTPQLRINFTGADTARVLYGGMQIEQGGVPSSLILPVAGSPGATTRGRDNLTVPFASVFPSGVGTVLGRARLDALGIGVNQAVLDINDGTGANRIGLRNPSGGSDLAVVLVAANSVIAGVSAGALTAGGDFRFGLSFDGTTITVCLDGGAAVSFAGAVAGPSVLRLGNVADGSQPMFGRAALLDVLPWVIPPAALPAAVAAVP